jgi:hypothetical protein
MPMSKHFLYSKLNILILTSSAFIIFGFLMLKNKQSFDNRNQWSIMLYETISSIELISDTLLVTCEKPVSNLCKTPTFFTGFSQVFHRFFTGFSQVFHRFFDGAKIKYIQDFLENDPLNPYAILIATFISIQLRKNNLPLPYCIQNVLNLKKDNEVLGRLVSLVEELYLKRDQSFSRMDSFFPHKLYLTNVINGSSKIQHLPSGNQCCK